MMVGLFVVVGKMARPMGMECALAPRAKVNTRAHGTMALRCPASTRGPGKAGPSPRPLDITHSKLTTLLDPNVNGFDTEEIYQIVIVCCCGKSACL